MSNAKKTILIVDDDAEFAEDLSRLIEKEGCAAEVAGDGISALSRVKRGGIDAIILDIILPGKEGLEVLTTLRERGIDIPVIVLSGVIHDQQRQDLINLGATEFFYKSGHSAEEVVQVAKTYL